MKKQITSIILTIAILLTAFPYTGRPVEATLVLHDLEVIRLVNAEREKVGVKPLATNIDALNLAAYVRAAELQQRFSHTRPNGTFWDTVISRSVDYHYAMEFIADGYTSPQEMVNALMASPDKRADLLNSRYTHMGVGMVNSNRAIDHYIWALLIVQADICTTCGVYPKCQSACTVCARRSCQSACTCCLRCWRKSCNCCPMPGCTKNSPCHSACHICSRMACQPACACCRRCDKEKCVCCPVPTCSRNTACPIACIVCRRATCQSRCQCCLNCKQRVCTCCPEKNCSMPTHCSTRCDKHAECCECCAKCSYCRSNQIAIWGSGRIAANPQISSLDALEILKSIVGLESMVDCGNARPAALITEASQQKGSPSAADALEILKYLVKLPSMVVEQ